MKIFKKLSVPLTFLVIGIFVMFSFMACDNNSTPVVINPDNPITQEPDNPITQDPDNPITLPSFESEEPATQWVNGNVTVDIFSFNDFHGTMDNSASASNPGAAKFVTGVKHAMQNSEHSMLLAAGDNYQGSAMSNYFNGKPVSEMMKGLGVKYSAIGNHEWDWGADSFKTFIKDGDISFLAANIFMEGTNDQPDFCHPYVIANRAGRRIGIVGLTTISTPFLVSSKHVEGYEFREAGDWLKSLVSDLRTNNNCDAVIALTHIGSSGAEINSLTAHNNSIGFDGIITGHSHTTVAGTVNGVPVVQGGFNGRQLAKLELKFDNDGLVSITPHTIAISTSNAEDSETKAMVDRYEALIGPIMNEAIGKWSNAKAVGKNAWANRLVYDYIARKEPVWKDVVLIQNAGGWRSIEPGNPDDNVTVGNMWTLMPFDNEIYLFELQGNYLINLLQGRPATGAGGLGSSVVITNASGSGSNWTINSSGTTITASGTYKVSMNDFMFTGGDNYGVEDLAQNLRIMGVPLRDGMIEQLKWRTANYWVPSEPSHPGITKNTTIGTLTGGALVHQYSINAANTRYLEDTALVHLVNDTMLYYTQSYNTTISATAPASATVNLQAGTITRSSIVGGVYTFADNHLCVVEMTGSQLKEWMEWSSWDYHRTNMADGDLTVPYGGGGNGYNFDSFAGLSYKIDLTKNRGSRIVEMKNMDGSAFDLNSTYRIAVNNYRMNQLTNPTSVIAITGVVTTVAQNVCSNLIVGEETLSNSEFIPGAIIDYIDRVKEGSLTNSFTKNWEIILPPYDVTDTFTDMAGWDSYRTQAVTLVNSGELNFVPSRAVTKDDIDKHNGGNDDEIVANGTVIVDFEDAAWNVNAYTSPVYVTVGDLDFKGLGYGQMDANDRRTGNRSFRLRGNNTDITNSIQHGIELTTWLPGIKSVSFSYGSYGTHSNGVVILYYQVRGSSEWIKVDEVTSPAWGGEMLSASFNFEALEIEFNPGDEVRIKIEKVNFNGSRSVNIDNIVIEW